MLSCHCLKSQRWTACCHNGLSSPNHLSLFQIQMFGFSYIFSPWLLRVKFVKSTWRAGICRKFISQVAPAKPQSHIMPPRFPPGSAWYCDCACHRNMDIMKRDIMSEIGMLCAQLIFSLSLHTLLRCLSLLPSHVLSLCRPQHDRSHQTFGCVGDPAAKWRTLAAKLSTQLDVTAALLV